MKHDEIRGGTPLLDWKPKARSSDPITSHEAAGLINLKLNDIHRSVILAYRTHGQLTARDCEQLPEHSSYGQTTIGRRCYELLEAGLLELRGIDRTNRAPRRILGLVQEPVRGQTIDAALGRQDADTWVPHGEGDAVEHYNGRGGR